MASAFAHDLADVASMTASGTVDPAVLLRLFEDIEDQLYRFPAVEAGGLRRAVVSLASASPHG